MIVSGNIGLQKTNVKNVVDLEVFWEFQFIGLRAYPLENLIWSTVPGTELLVLPK